MMSSKQRTGGVAKGTEKPAVGAGGTAAGAAEAANDAAEAANNAAEAANDGAEAAKGADEAANGGGTREQALDQLFSATYEELRRLAAAVRRGDRSETLNPTALVNEAYLKLVHSLPPAPDSHLHFKRIAARAMRQVLVEAARRHRALKRGGAYALVTLDESLDAALTSSEDLLGLDAALDDLARMHPRQALLVEYRFFGGFDLAETAALLNVSEATIVRDWRAARAWLALELRRGR
jgi:RNA polymerase sigma factor (TIGR02999 family)